MRQILLLPLAALLAMPVFSQTPADTTLTIRNIEIQGTRFAGLSERGGMKILRVDNNLSSVTNTAADAFRQLPSVITDMEGAVTYRGSGNVGMLVDGVPYGLLEEYSGDVLIQLPALFFNQISLGAFPPINAVPDGDVGILNLVPGASLDIYINVIGFVYVTILFTYYKWYMAPISNKCAILLMVVGGLIIFGWNLLLSVVWRIWNMNPDRILNYINPVQKEWALPILAISFGVFVLFTRLHFSSRIVNRCAQSAFAVYLITEQHYFRDEILWRYITLGGIYRSRYAIGIALVVVIGIVAAAIMLDFVRQFLFWRTVDRHKGRLFEWVWDRAWRIVGEFKTNYVAYKSVNKE